MRYYELMEDRADFIIDKMNDVLVSRYMDDTHTDRNSRIIVDQLLAADPTKKQMYIQWIANMYIKKQFKMEDIPRIKNELIEFDRVKAKLANKDIMSYKALTDLYSVLAPFKEIEVISNNSAESQLRDSMYKQSELIYKGSDYMLISPKTEEASCYFGRGTKWCTASKDNNQFNGYNNQAPLLILIDASGNKYQMWIPEPEDDDIVVMDSSDTALPLLNLFTKYKSLSDLLENKTSYSKWMDPTNLCSARWYAENILHSRWKEAEPYILKDCGSAYEYAIQVIKGRWKEAESIIATQSMFAYLYARRVIKGRWKEAEYIILSESDDLHAVLYAQHVIKGRWEEAEPSIMKSDCAFQYAQYVIKGRWLEAETYIKETTYWYDYIRKFSV